MPDSRNDHAREERAHERDNQNEQHGLRPGKRTGPMAEIVMARLIVPAAVPNVLIEKWADDRAERPYQCGSSWSKNDHEDGGPTTRIPAAGSAAPFEF